MAKSGFFTQNGALGIGGASDSALKANFGTTSTGASAARLLVADNSTNSIMRVHNNHFINMDANVNILDSGVVINELNSPFQSISGVKVSMQVNGYVVSGRLILKYNSPNAVTLMTSGENLTESYDLTFPTSAPTNGSGDGQVLVYDENGEAIFRDYFGSSSTPTLQESYDAGTDPNKGEIILASSNPFFIQGNRLSGGDPIAAFTAVGNAAVGDSYQKASSFVLLRDSTNDTDLTLQFNGAFVQLRANTNIVIESTNGTVDVDGNTIDVDGTDVNINGTSATTVDGLTLNLGTTNATDINVGSTSATTVDIYGITIDINGTTTASIDALTTNLGDINATSINMGTGAATAITIGNTTNNATLTINANTRINGDLTVEGNLTTINTENLVVEDPLILLGNGNNADDKDRGLLLRYVASGSNKNAAIFRDTSANNNAFTLAQNVTVNDTADIVTVQGNSYADLIIGNLVFTENGAANGCDITIPDNKNNALDIKDTNDNVLMSFNTNNSANDVIVTIYGNLNASDANNSGGGVISAVQFLTTSDATLKENIQTIENATDIVGNVRGVSYTWKNNQNMTEPIYGVLAQEVEQVLPGAVNTDGAGFKTVAYNQLIGVLFEAVKELSNQVSEIKTQILG